MSAEGESRQRRSEAMLLQKNLKSWSAEMPFLVFWEDNFKLKCSLNRLSFICLFLFTMLCVHSTPINFIFCSVYKVFCTSVSVISKLVYSVIIVFLYKYHKNSFENIKTDVKIGIFAILIACWSEFRFSRKTWRITTKSEWLDSLYCQRRCQLLEI